MLQSIPAARAEHDRKSRIMAERIAGDELHTAKCNAAIALAKEIEAIESHDAELALEMEAGGELVPCEPATLAMKQA